MVTRKELARRSFVERGVEFPTAEKLSGVVETTALRRGRTESLESIFNPYNPMPEPPNQPAPPPISMPIPPPQNIFAIGPFPLSELKAHTPPPQVQQPQQPDLFANIFAPPPPPPKATVQPCGGKTPYAKNGSTGQIFCTQADFEKVFGKTTAPTGATKTCPPGYFLDSATRERTSRTAKCRRQLFDASGKYLW